MGGDRSKRVWRFPEAFWSPETWQVRARVEVFYGTLFWDWSWNTPFEGVETTGGWWAPRFHQEARIVSSGRAWKIQRAIHFWEGIRYNTIGEWYGFGRAMREVERVVNAPIPWYFGISLRDELGRTMNVSDYPEEYILRGIPLPGPFVE
jgi:hypothetical protein